MADLLNFKKGLRANLPSTKVAGTIYVTTDERAMYVDLDANRRIRLGDFNVYENNAALQAETQFSETALYYVKDTGILYACVQVTSNSADLKPINDFNGLTTSVAQIQAALANKVEKTELASTVGTLQAAIALKADQTALESAVETLNGAIDDVADDLADTDAIVAGHTTAIATKAEQADVDAAVEELEDAIALKADITALNAVEEAYKAADNGLNVLIGENASAISELRTGVATKAEVADVHALIGVNADGKVSDGVVTADTVVAFVNDKFTAFNAMTFKGSVSKYEDLPETADAGDTWLLNANDSGYAAGDLFVANADGEASWTHVPSGYNQIHEQKLVGDATRNQIQLYNETNTALTTALTVATSGAVVASVTDGASPTLTIGMEWGSF